MRVAVVDIGSNSTRLLLAVVSGGRVTSELERRSSVTRLGVDVDADGRLREDAMQRVFSTLDGYAEVIARHGADARLAVLTSAVRDSENGADFAGEVQRRYGLVPHVLSGDEEAQLTFLGATSERDPADTEPTLVIDIGGGSTELVIGAGHELRFHVSAQAGVVRQTERHISQDPPMPNELEELAADVGSVIDAAVPVEYRNAVASGIAVAGTATSLAAIAQELDPYDPSRVHGYVLTRKVCAGILERLAALRLEQRREVAGLHPDRAPTILAGVVILREVLARFSLDRVEVSEHDILRGAALGLSS
jgi:exopolyphosphatase / guanosine-5'-triphosphate,3'-diphosphate pyrophosphatase